ncbi:MAG: ATP-binding protein [Alphaproteobacteria bacterium]|nr:ATP-binding protein [Alphaproteobacteria bacterium]
MRHRRLIPSLILRLVAVVSATTAVMAVLLVGWVNPPPNEVHYWWHRAFGILTNAVERDTDGRLVIRETAALAELRALQPSLAVAVIARDGGEIAMGSNPVLVEALAPRGQMLPLEAVWHDETAVWGPYAGAGAQRLANTEVTVLIAGIRPDVQDWLGFSARIAGDILLYLLPAYLAICLVCWLLVRRALAPLREAAAEIAQLDFRNTGARLPEDQRVPLDLLPLTQGVNRALDQLEEGFQRQRRFTTNAAHEIRTPLAVLMARLDTSDTPLPRGALRRDAARIALLIEQMLAIARLEHQSEALEPLDLAEIGMEVACDLASLAADRGSRIEFYRPPEPVPILGAPAALRSAIGNLVHNALQVEPPGGTVLVTVAEDASLRVSDHGPCVPPDLREQVFEPFWRGGARYGGSGLGLAIAREIADLHGGTLVVEATDPSGATFVLALPRRAAASGTD